MNFDGTSYYVDIGNSNQLKTPSYSFMLNFKISEHNGGVLISDHSDSPQSGRTIGLASELQFLHQD